MIKLIQLIVITDQVIGGHRQILFGLADDGSVWKMDLVSAKWEKVSGGIK